MSPKLTQADRAERPGQGTLLYADPFGGEHLTPLVVKDSNNSLEITEGPSVDIAARDVALYGLLDQLSIVSRSRGFSRAAEHPDFRSPIVARYGGQTDKIVNGALDRASSIERYIERPFSEAFGQSQMVSSGLWTAEEAKANTLSSLEDFKRTHGGGSENQPKRDQFRKTLKKNIKKINKLKEAQETDNVSQYKQ